MTNFILTYLLIGMIISIVFAAFISKIGAKKEIGGTAAFIISLFLSPLLGLVIVLSSDDLKDGERKPVDEKAVAVTMLILVVLFAAIAAALSKAAGQVNNALSGIESKPTSSNPAPQPVKEKKSHQFTVIDESKDQYRDVGHMRIFVLYVGQTVSEEGLRLLVSTGTWDDQYPPVYSGNERIDIYSALERGLTFHVNSRSGKIVDIIETDANGNIIYDN
jgi:hypothetical protein